MREDFGERAGEQGFVETVGRQENVLGGGEITDTGFDDVHAKYVLLDTKDSVSASVTHYMRRGRRSFNVTRRG